MACINFIILVLFMSTSSFAKTFEQCELVRKLSRQGFSEYLMKDLMCLVEIESSSQTHLKRRSHTGDSTNRGLFQINDRLWCNNRGWAGNSCNVRCEDLLADDISVAARCAQMIVLRYGLNVWESWRNCCKNKFLSDLDCIP